MSSYDGSARDYFRRNLTQAQFKISIIFENLGFRKQEQIGQSLFEHLTDLQEQIQKEYNQNFDMSKGIPYLFRYIVELGEQIDEKIRDINHFCKVKTEINIIMTIGEIIKHYENYLDMRIHDEYYKIHQKKSELICKEFGMGDDAYCEFVKYLRSGEAFPEYNPYKVIQ